MPKDSCADPGSEVETAPREGHHLGFEANLVLITVRRLASAVSGRMPRSSVTRIGEPRDCAKRDVVTARRFRGRGANPGKHRPFSWGRPRMSQAPGAVSALVRVGCDSFAPLNEGYH